MRNLSGINSGINMGGDLGEDTQASPRKARIRRATAIVAGVAVAAGLTAIAILKGVVCPVVVRPAEDGAATLPPAASDRSVIPQKWRDLQRPLPALEQSGKEEGDIAFRARSTDDPFAVDIAIAGRLRVTGPPLASWDLQAETDSGVVDRSGADASTDVASQGSAKPEESPDGGAQIRRQEDASLGLPRSPATSGPDAAIKAPDQAVVDAPASHGAPPLSGLAATGEEAPAVRIHQAADTRQGVGGQTPSGGSEDGRVKPDQGTDGADAETSPSAPSVDLRAAPSPVSSLEGGAAPPGAQTPRVELALPSGKAREGGPEVGDQGTLVPQKPRVEPPRMVLTGIISAGGSVAYAIVRTPRGSIIVRPGEEAEGATVESVGERSITVLKEGEEFVLELGGGSER
ncbi:MAG: hypothetical protein NUW12_03050 [Firmicutes bacterium]|nr:hypothetical protein [Bacillota bacterium]MDH7495059.1 hypothetical protein [Bacillota bacterium]